MTVELIQVQVMHTHAFFWGLTRTEVACVYAVRAQSLYAQLDGGVIFASVIREVKHNKVFNLPSNHRWNRDNNNALVSCSRLRSICSALAVIPQSVHHCKRWVEGPVNTQALRYRISSIFKSKWNKNAEEYRRSETCKIQNGYSIRLRTLCFTLGMGMW